MAGERNQWWPCKLKYLEANYERCKLKVRQDSLYCKLFILEYQNRLEEEKRITLKYEKNAVYQRLQQAEQKHLELTNEKELVVKKAVGDFTNVEGEWKAKTDKLIKDIESLQEEKENEIKSKDDYILELTKELQVLKKLSQSKEPHAAGNADEQSGNKRKLVKTKGTQELRKQNCQNSTTSNSIEAQYPDDIVPEETKTVSENRKGNCDVGGSNLVSDNFEKSETSDGEKLSENEIGSVLEVTEEMLKSCRRRSVLKKKKPDVCGLEDNDSELSDCTNKDATRRERRVTFNGELEFKLPDGRKEIAELVIDDSSEQLESHDGQNGREDDLEVFDDILSRETHVRGEGLDTECNALEKGSEMAGMKTWNLEGEDERKDNKLKNEMESCEVREGEETLENVDTRMNGNGLDKNLDERKRKTDLRKKSKKKEGNKIVVQQGSVKKNQRVAVDTEINGENDKNSGDKGKDKIEKMKVGENRRILVEADILLSADRQCQDVKLNSGHENTVETTKTSKTENKVECEKSNSNEVANAQLGGTGGREINYGPRRGLRREASGAKKTSKRLLDVFGNEVDGNEEPQNSQSKEKSRRNRRGSKTRTSNAVAKNKLVDIPISNENFEKEDLEKQRDESLKDEAAFENEDASDYENKSRTRKTRSKKASGKTTKTRKYAAKIENEVEGTSRKRRGKRGREETTKETRESLLAIENEEESKNKEMEEHGRKSSKEQNCSPKQLSPLPGEVESADSKSEAVEDDAEEEQKIVDKKCGEEVKDDVQQTHNMVDEKYGKEEDGLLIEKKTAVRRRSRRKTQEKINKVEDPNIFDEIKERKPNLRSKKRKSLELESDEENNHDGKQNLNENRENVHDCIEIDEKIGIAEENEEHVNESERKQAKVNNVTADKKRKTNLRSRKRKSSELEIDDDGIQDVNENNEDEKAEQVNGSESNETKVSMLDEVKKRKTTLRSKKRKSPVPEIDVGEIMDLNEEDVRVENGETNESLCENIDKEIDNKRQSGKNTKSAKRKSDTVVVNSAARKTKSRKGKKREEVVDDDQMSEDVGLNVEDQEIKRVEGDDEDKASNGKKTNKRGRKRVAKGESEIKIMNKNKDGNEKMENVTGRVDDEDKENCERKSKRKGRKRELADSGENDMKGKEKGSEKGRSTRKTIEDENKREAPGKTEKQEKTTKKKRRTLYSIRENTTFFNATSSIFQETLPFNQTRSSTGMPPSLSSFMKAFIVPKLKKK